MRRRPTLSLLAVIALAFAVAMPTLAADPSASPGAGGPKGPKASKAPEVELTLTGTVATTTDAEGATIYTMASGGKTYTLEAGPKWFHGDNHPLKPFVGKSVTIVGEAETGSTEVDVKSVDGTRLRAAGRPLWAGGWRRVGAKHPGWSQEKLDRFQAKFGSCFPPGQCKNKDKTGDRGPAATTRPEGP